MMRRATIEDIPQILKVEEACFPDPWPDFLFMAHLNNPGFVVYEKEAKILGFAIIGDTEEKAHLQNIGVDPEYRRQGIGTELLEWCMDLVGLYGYSEIMLEVREKNTSSQLFYRNMGFEIKGCVKGYYLDDNAVKMGRKI